VGTDAKEFRWKFFAPTLVGETPTLLEGRGAVTFRQWPQPWPQPSDGCRRMIRRMKTATVTAMIAPAL